jgi:hypothetical protein
MGEPAKAEIRYSSGGTPFQAWEPPVPRIPDEYLDCSIYLYGSEADAYAGVRSGGSGFLLGFDSERIPGMQNVFAVTNAHVIEGGSYTVRLNKNDGSLDVRDFDERHWIVPKSNDDIAICLMSSVDAQIHKYKCVPHRMLATREKVAEFAIGPGDETIAIGRFVNADGIQRNLPTVRFGNIAQMPGEPIRQDRQISGLSKPFEQESYLVEAKSISGFSGSPVFVTMSPFGSRPKEARHSSETHLLGVSWGYVLNWESVRAKDGSLSRSGEKVRVNTGMMGVVPAWHLHDLLMRPDIAAMRKASEDKYLAMRPLSTSALTGASVEPSRSATDANPKHREDFMRLVDAAARKPPQED